MKKITKNTAKKCCKKNELLAWNLSDLYNGIDIYFKHKANKEISKLTMKEASVIEAIQTISPEHMNDQIRKKLLNTLSEQEMQHLLEQGKSMRYWIYDEIKTMKDEREYL